jgi:hypothetical protein
MRERPGLRQEVPVRLCGPCGAALNRVFLAGGDQARAGQGRDEGHYAGHREDRRKRCAAAAESGQSWPGERDGDGIDPDDAGSDGERQHNQLLLRQL